MREARRDSFCGLVRKVCKDGVPPKRQSAGLLDLKRVRMGEILRFEWSHMCEDGKVRYKWSQTWIQSEPMSIVRTIWSVIAVKMERKF